MPQLPFVGCWECPKLADPGVAWVTADTTHGTWRSPWTQMEKEPSGLLIFPSLSPVRKPYFPPYFFSPTRDFICQETQTL